VEQKFIHEVKNNYLPFALHGVGLSCASLSIWEKKLSTGKKELQGKFCCVFYPCVSFLRQSVHEREGGEAKIQKYARAKTVPL